MKNKYWIHLNLEEAKMELDKIVLDIEKDDEYSEENLKIALEHVYHHLNFAWNIRNEDEEKIAKCLSEDFRKWSKYPIDDITEYD